jgi:hypothetical protein
MREIWKYVQKNGRNGRCNDKSGRKKRTVMKVGSLLPDDMQHA